MNARMTVLGGSSPFTIALIDALCDAGPQLQPRELVLHGRNVEALRLIVQYARNRLSPFGWRAIGSQRIDQAVSGADIVLHQIRYGGLEIRAAGERMCQRWRLPADETLGPAALLTALPLVDELREVCETLRRYSPNAWVMNLTNPLSSITTLMHECGVHRCIGVCELPVVTLEEFAARCGCPPETVEWAYSGLNHRGFLHHIRSGKRDLIEELAQAAEGADASATNFEAAGRRQIAELRAVPLKYFRLVQGPNVTRVSAGRAEFLETLRRQILSEVAEAPDRSPPSLAQRYLEWYPRAVVPIVQALESATPLPRVINIPGGDGLVREVRAHVSRDGIVPLNQPRPPAAVIPWLETFERHERAFVECLRAPSRARIEDALRLDPLLQTPHTEHNGRVDFNPRDEQVFSITEAIWTAYHTQEKELRRKRSA